MDPIHSLPAALVLAAVHVVSPGLRLLSEIPRSRLLSVAGGMAVAFVVVELLPAIARGQTTFARAGGAGAIPFLRNHVYVVVLFGLVLFYGLERAAKTSRARRRREGEGDATGIGVFWLHTAMFALVNALIAYLLVFRARLGPGPLAFFALAMALKLVVNDHGLYADHKRAYDRVGRWILAAAVLLGWGAGFALAIPPVAPALLQAFVAGAILLNVLKEELPEYRESHFGAFAAGAAAYAAVLLAV